MIANLLKTIRHMLRLPEPRDPKRSRAEVERAEMIDRIAKTLADERRDPNWWRYVEQARFMVERNERKNRAVMGMKVEPTSDPAPLPRCDWCVTLTGRRELSRSCAKCQSAVDAARGQ